jgi:hypothetical protein
MSGVIFNYYEFNYYVHYPIINVYNYFFEGKIKLVFDRVYLFSHEYFSERLDFLKIFCQDVEI